MTSQNPTRKDAKPLTNPNDDVAPKAAEPSEIKRELTDEEIAAVAGGVVVVKRPPSGVISGSPF
jgi:hypothetical protein